MTTPSKPKEAHKNWIKFIGTAGARFVVARQLRASGGRTEPGTQKGLPPSF